MYDQTAVQAWYKDRVWNTWENPQGLLLQSEVWFVVPRYMFIGSAIVTGKHCGQYAYCEKPHWHRSPHTSPLVRLKTFDLFPEREKASYAWASYCDYVFKTRERAEQCMAMIMEWKKEHIEEQLREVERKASLLRMKVTAIDAYTETLAKHGS